MYAGRLLIVLGHILVFIFEQTLGRLSSLGDLGTRGGILREGLLGVEVDGISSGHYVRIVKGLNERLDP